MKRLIPALFLGVLAACGGPREAVDAGRVCLSDPMPTGSTPGETELLADAPLVLHAQASAGCHTDELEISCEATVDGDVVTVTTLTTWVRTEPLATNCESILYLASATCETPPLEAGSYTLVYGDDELVVDIPGTAPADDCLEASGGGA